MGVDLNFYFEEDFEETVGDTVVDYLLFDDFGAAVTSTKVPN